MARGKSEDKNREQAPTRSEYNRMMAGIEENMEGEMKLQCKFLLVTIGELGLRPTEFTHIRRARNEDKWVDLHDHKINIPGWDLCDCGYCRKQAKQAANKKDGGTDEEELRDRWKPHNDASERSVYFHYDTDIIDLYKTFFTVYDEWPTSRVTVNRRVKRIVKAADIQRDPDSISPITLRHTAANYHADSGMGPFALKELMGWESEETALKYIREASNGLRSELRRIHQSD